MSVNIISIGRSKPGEESQEMKKYYALVKASGEDTLHDITEKIEKMSTVSGVDIRAVLYALVEVMKMSIADGKIIRLGDFGSFRVSVSSLPEETPEDVGAKSVKDARIIYNPDKRLKSWLRKLKYKKV